MANAREETEVEVSMVINGFRKDVRIRAATLLVTFLRETCGLTGTHIGCDTSNCGACTVLVDEHAVKSCTMLAVQADGSAIQTIESLATYDDEGQLKLHPLQLAFAQEHALQCGFCTPGMIMAALGLINDRTDLSDEVIRHELEGNLCRCTGYQGIVRAVSHVARQRREPLVGGGEL